MPRPPKKLYTDYEKQLLKNIILYSKRIQRLYNDAIVEVSLSVGTIKNTDKTFTLNLYPSIRAKIDTVLREMQKELIKTVNKATKEAWDLSNKKNDIVTKTVLGKRSLPKGVTDKIFNPNLRAFDAFMARRDKGLSLSKRIWNNIKPFRYELEAGLTAGINEGKSAASMATEMKKYLKEPDKLFRRVKDADGKMRLSKAAKEYHPGQGVYRSSYKNALRLTRTETNMAYRNADYERWLNMPFVLGIEIKLSNSHPKYDICFVNPNINVLTSKGWEKIHKIKEGDLVLSHKGKFRKVLTKFKTHCKEVGVTKISGKFMYDSRGKTNSITATDNHPFLVNGEWKRISEIVVGDECSILANECKKCGSLIPHTRLYCSKSCASYATATNQHNNPLHKEKLRIKRNKLIAENGGKIPYFKEWISSKGNQLNLERTPERIAKTREAVMSMVNNGTHPFQRPDNMSKAMKVLGQKKYSTFIEKKVEWLLKSKNIPHFKQFEFIRDVECKNGNNRRYFIDFVLKDHKIAIEVDGEYWHKDKDADNKRQCEIESKGYIMLRFSGDQVRNRLHECSAELDRVLMNHNGEYKFMPFKIENVTKRNFKGGASGVTKYNLEVEKDNSYIANGFVVHNCDPLTGVYPKQFKWAGWHPQCLCYAVPVLANAEQFSSLEDEILGISEDKADLQQVTKMPKGFKDYVKKNRKRIEGWKEKPYWAKDNPELNGL